MERFYYVAVWVDGEMRNGVIRNAHLKPPRLSTAAKWVSLDIEITTRRTVLRGLEGCGQRTVYMGPANGDDLPPTGLRACVCRQPPAVAGKTQRFGLPNMICCHHRLEH